MRSDWVKTLSTCGQALAASLASLPPWRHRFLILDLARSVCESPMVGEGGEEVESILTNPFFMVEDDWLHNS
jgi:hypothetical protein